MNTTADLKNVIQKSYPQMSNSSVERLLQLYPNDPRIGCPYETGDALVSTGPLDKVSNAIYGYVRASWSCRVAAYFSFS